MVRYTERFRVLVSALKFWYFSYDGSLYYRSLPCFASFYCALCPGFEAIKFSTALRSEERRVGLCDALESSKYGAAQCYTLIGGCQGAPSDGGGTDACYPHDIWASTQGSNSCRYWRILKYGSFDENCYPVTYAFSVRCVLDLTYVFHKIEKIQNADIFAAVRPS